MSEQLRNAMIASTETQMLAAIEALVALARDYNAGITVINNLVDKISAIATNGPVPELAQPPSESLRALVSETLMYRSTAQTIDMVDALIRELAEQ